VKSDIFVGQRSLQRRIIRGSLCLVQPWGNGCGGGGSRIGGVGGGRKGNRNTNILWICLWFDRQRLGGGGEERETRNLVGIVS